MDTQTTASRMPADRAETTEQAKQAAQDVAATAGEEAKRTAREAKDQARELWSQTRSDLTDQATVQQSRAASGLHELAEQLGSMARAADQDGPARGLVEDVARRVDDAASWLDARDPGSLLDETRGFARRRPGTFLAVAAGLGVVAGRLSRSLVDEARDSDGTDSLGAQGTGRDSLAAPSSSGGTSAPSSSGGIGMPTATSPTASTTASTPVTPGSAPAAVSQGASSVPSGDLPGPHRTTQPMAPDGSPSPIDADGHLTAEGEHPLRGGR